LIVVWYQDWKICIWDVEKGELLQEVDTFTSEISGTRISGDGSKVFLLAGWSIQAWSIQTYKPVGQVELDNEPYFDPLYVDGSKVWVCFKDLSTWGWDFGTSGTSPIQLSNTSVDNLHLNLIGGRRWNPGPCTIKDAVTGKEVFQLVGRYAPQYEVQWDGQYLVTGYDSGEVLILDFKHALPW